MKQLKVGLMGLGRGGQQVADALLSSAWCRLVAVASPKSKRLEQFAEAHPGLATYDDFRSLIVENPLDALFVAVPPYARLDYLPLAAERGLGVWMLPPAARRFDEALELIGLFGRYSCPIVVSRSWGIEAPLQFHDQDREEMGKIFLARGHVMTCWGEDLDWRGDSVRAGGGVLLDRGYGLVDAVVQAMGLPTTVHATAGGGSRPGGRFPYDTEDTAVLVCQFSEQRMAVLTACWTAGPPQWFIELNGVGGTLSIDGERVVRRDRKGEHILREHARPANPLLPQIEEFLSRLGRDETRMPGGLQDHLGTMAVIHAAYLSSRTGERETPGSLFELHDVRNLAPRAP